MLYAQGFRGKIYTTKPTVDLCEIMLKDSAHIQQFESEWRNRKAKRSNGTLKEFVPLYSIEDAVAVMKQFVGCAYDEKLISAMESGFALRMLATCSARLILRFGSLRAISVKRSFSREI